MIIMIVGMEGSSFNIDLAPFPICPWCLRFLPILAAETYLIYLFISELLQNKKCYDRMDRIIFFLSGLSLITDIVSAVVF